MSEINSQPERKGINPVTGIVCGIVAVLVLLVMGWIPRVQEAREQQAVAESANQPPTVDYVNPKRPPRFDQVTLAGNVQAAVQATISAQATGYLQNVYADIGDHVTTGQLLATISAPEDDQMLLQARSQLVQADESVSQSRADLTSSQGSELEASSDLAKAEDSLVQANATLIQNRAQLLQAKQQVAQAQAQLDLANANLKLAKVTNDRQQNLLKEGFVSQESADQTDAAYQTNVATVNAAKASLDASKSNVSAVAAALNASEANVASFRDGVASSRAAVLSARANVSASQFGVSGALANAGSYEANVERYAAQQRFQSIVAPFPGIITARYIDPGSLVTSGTGSATGAQTATPTGLTVSAPSAVGGEGALFTIADPDKLRVYINVPQDDAPGVRAGLPAVLSVAEMPKAHFMGNVVATAGALDPVSRTLLVEVELNNANGQLHPGSFAEVTLRVPRPRGVLMIPDNALVTNAGGTQVALVTPQNKVHYAVVVIGRDYGSVMQILSGVTSKDQLILNPTDSLLEGEAVHPMLGVFPSGRSKS